MGFTQSGTALNVIPFGNSASYLELSITALLTSFCIYDKKQHFYFNAVPAGH